MGLLTARPSSAYFAVEHPFFLDIKENTDWQNQFGNSHPLKLEIGFGMGDFLIAMARNEPESNFVGIDFSQDCVLKLLERIDSFQLKNIRVVFGDVREKLPVLFQDEELDSVYINLPDPWPKKRHSRRRLIQPGLIKQITKKLADRGRVYLATDSQTYAHEMLEYFLEEPLLKNRNGILNERKHLPKSKYEKSFIYAGDKIHYIEYCKSDRKEEQSENKNPPVSFDENSISNDEYLTRKFKAAEASAKDSCDLKQVADQLVEAGDRDWARSVYKKAEEKAEDCLDLNWLAYSVVFALNETDWAVKIYREAEKCVENSLDLNWLAYSIFESLNDKQWAEKLFQKAEIKTNNIRELCDLAESVSEILENKEWQFKIYKKAAEEAKEFSEYYELADNIFAKLNDEKWARELYLGAEGKGEDFCDLLSLAESFIEKMGDGEGARRIYKKAEGRAQDGLDFSCLAESLEENLGDKDWAQKIFRKGKDYPER